MKIYFPLFLLIFTAISVIFSCSKNNNSNSGTKPCVNVTLVSTKGTDSQIVGFNVPINPISYKISNNPSSDTSGLSVVSVSSIGLPAGITTTYSGGVLTISGAATKDSSSPYVYTIIATGNTCSVPLKGVISVKTCATINISTPSEPYFQTVAVDSAIKPINYTIGGGGTGATVTGLPNGVTGSFSNGIFTISGKVGNIPDSTYQYKITTSGGYCNAIDSGTIVVSTCPTVKLTSAPGTDNQTVTASQNIIPITYAISGNYTSVSVNNFNTVGLWLGLTSTFNNGILTITGSLAQQVYNPNGPTFEYIITVTTKNISCNATNTNSIQYFGFINLQ